MNKKRAGARWPALTVTRSARADRRLWVLLRLPRAVRNPNLQWGVAKDGSMMVPSLTAKPEESTQK